MPRRGNRYFTLVKGAEKAMEAFKLEIARDLGYDVDLENNEDFYRKLTTEQVGQIGGEMVRRIQAAGEKAIMDRFKSGAERLMPDVPGIQDIRNVTNTGRIPM